MATADGVCIRAANGWCVHVRSRTGTLRFGGECPAANRLWKPVPFAVVFASFTRHLQVWKQHSTDLCLVSMQHYIEPNGTVISTSYIGWPGIPRGCGTSLELNTCTDIRQISVVISDIPAQSEVAAVQCVFSRRLNITVLLLLYKWHLTNALLATMTCVQCPCNIFVW